ncbi:capsule assembly Wzi family protein [Salegentibacter sp. F188]|uniref:Capsule assembly Wzi family protein n=1 Tax=Autumnicola patrickiae TaxID=3075591 RepID=A0ABU3E1P5_9FLAO|nr:capsule assembly Wzi family protein [Salegentibacter sp. F188]MDT0689845.1 capsule assembly Wzi family protein [Salegentibacter sp. F188]
MKSLKILFVLIFFIQFKATSQNLQYSLDINSYGTAYSKEESPFWIHSNKRGRVNESSNLTGWINGEAQYFITENASIEVGMGLLYHDGYNSKLKFDESYLSFENSWLNITAGRKQREELFLGLSASNESILWSLNARPLLGFRIETTKPVFLFNDHGIGFTGSFGEYYLDDERFVQNVRVHHKSFNLVYKSAGNFQLSAGLQHFVQWAGVSPEYGKLSDGWEDYLRIFLGGQGDNEAGVAENAEGNQIGSYEVKLKTELSDYKIELLYNHLFEDGSGRMLFNTPDGRYGIFIEDTYKLSENNWIKALMYELYYTLDQSEGSGTTDGDDNYFSHNLYKSGWTYENRIIGMPFITMNDNRIRVYNNTLVAHHLGITGMAFNSYPYKLLNSYRINYGYKGNDVLDNKILSSFLEVEVYNLNNLNINIQVGADIISNAPANVGAGILLTKTLY